MSNDRICSRAECDRQTSRKERKFCSAECLKAERYKGVSAKYNNKKFPRRHRARANEGYALTELKDAR